MKDRGGYHKYYISAFVRHFIINKCKCPLLFFTAGCDIQWNDMQCCAKNVIKQS